MATVNEAIRDEQIGHRLALGQFSNGVVRRIVALLNRTDASLLAALSEALLSLDADSFTVERLEQQLASVRRINSQAYALIQQSMDAEIRDAAGYEAGYQLSLFQSLIPELVRVRFPIAGVTVEQAYAAAMSRPFQGRLLRDWYQSLSDTRMASIRNTVREGFLLGETTDQIVRRLRGTRAEQYVDGKLEVGRRDLRTIVHTAVSHTAQTAREQFISANSDLIKAEQWLSTLDAKTSAPCRLRDGLKYEAKTHRPIGHKVPWLQGPGRLHFNCRSTSTPVIKSWRELGFDIDELDAATRASMDGQLPADTTYAEWLARQSAARQDQVLGPVRAKLFREGKLSLADMYDHRGNWLTLEQLRERDEAALASIAA